MAIIDTHCHLDFPQFDDDRGEVFDRATEQGVSGFILIGIDPASWGATRKLATFRSDVWRAAGLHPNSVESHWNDELEGALRDEIAAGELVAVGETGVDLYRSKASKKLQMEAFDRHIEIAISADLPIIIHQRRADAEVLDVLARHRGVRGVMHCFSGDWEFGRNCLDAGLHLGIGGVATYKSAAATRDAIRRAPEDRLLLETDAPYLAPQGHRGNRNEPAYLGVVVETIAACRGTDASSVEAKTTRNASELFGLGVA